VNETTGQFIASPFKSLAHPFIASKAFSLNNMFMYHNMVACQYSQVGQAAKARSAHARALDLNPGFTGKIPEYAAFLIKQKSYADALALIDRIKDEANVRFQFSLLKGQALAGLERYDEAILSLLRRQPDLQQRRRPAGRPRDVLLQARRFGQGPYPEDRREETTRLPRRARSRGD
jgi:tetratricopeptide (TPR) repeat protein